MKKIFNFQFSIFKKQHGFTLIELLIVVVIIGILSSLLTANFLSVRARSRDAQRKADLKQMQAALEIYRADQGGYKIQNVTPYQLSTADCPTSSDFKNPAGTVTYMQKIPCDPSGTSVYNAGDYYYYSDGVTYTIAACMENTGDTSGTNTTPSPAGTGTCSSGWYFVVKNP